MMNITGGFNQSSELTFLALKGFALGCLFIWTIIANALVFVVLYKNPRLQTVPNLLVGNLAFSDLCLGCIVLPLSAVYAVTLQWSFGKIACEIWISTDVLCCTASIWNLSMIGLDRYWAITSPITYITKRNVRSAILMILAVWAFSCLISLAPFLGWRQYSDRGNYFRDNVTNTTQCLHLQLPSYTIYSATGSFYIPLLVMFFVYFQIYRAFADHRARQIYRQKVIKKHIESTILHEISHVLPTSDEFAKEKDDDDDDDDEDEDDEDSFNEDEQCSPPPKMPAAVPHRSAMKINNERSPLRPTGGGRHHPLRDRLLTYERVQRHKMRKEKRAMLRASLQKKPPAISAAKEKRGVKVLGIVLGCFTICWFPFFTMYIFAGFCTSCKLNAHVEQFITWLGYSNSAMNPIIYTVFNR